MKCWVEIAMNDDKKTAAGNAIKSVTNIGIATNIYLLVTKLAVGFFSGSIALVADGRPPNNRESGKSPR